MNIQTAVKADTVKADHAEFSAPRAKRPIPRR